MNWQPIETAPRDGTWILAVDSRGVMYIVQSHVFEDEPPQWWNDDVYVDPTHWMPLPEPPKEDKQL